MVKNLLANAAGKRNMTRPLGLEDPQEEEIVTHSVILAWDNPMGRGAWLLSMGW